VYLFQNDTVFNKHNRILDLKSLQLCSWATEKLTMNRNQIMLIVVPFLLIFGYQNCQKSNFDPATNSLKYPSESVSTQDVQTILLANESLEKLHFKSNEVAQVSHGSSQVSVVKSLLYSFDLASGEFHVIDQGAQTDIKYCLSENQKAQVNVLLSAGSICKNGLKVIEGMVCAQVITEGYANIVTNRDEFHLGSATDGCGSNSVDLCEGSNQLKNWFQSVRANLAHSNCAN
jgi:hypothetical protein